MKKALEHELRLLAENILSPETEMDAKKLKKVAGELYDKLTILSHVEEQKEAAQQKLTDEKQNNPTEDDERYSPDGTQYNPEAITEPNTEKIKDITREMPPESPKVNETLNKVLPEEDFENELQNIGVHYDDLPQFEPVPKSEPEPPKKENPKPPTEPESIIPPSFEPKQTNETPPPNKQKKSLNDRLKKGISFGLNDRLVFIKHLFWGSSSDYDRVLSQLNTFHSFPEAKEFIDSMVKPDYDEWRGKEAYAERFLTAIENKMN